MIMMKTLSFLLLTASLLPHALLASDPIIVDKAEEENHVNLRGIETRDLCTFVVTIKLNDSNGSPLANELIQSVTLFKPNSGGQTFSSLTTGTSGQVTVNPTGSKNVNLPGITVTVRYRNTIAQQTNVDLSGCAPPPVTFQTDKAKVRVLKANGSGLGGVEVKYFTDNTGGGTVGTTNSQGYAETELFPDDTKFNARYRKTSVWSSGFVDITPGDIDETFQLTNIVVTVSECGSEAHEKPVPGVEVKYWVDNSGGGDVGTTDANGRVRTELFAGTMDFTAKINKTSKTIQDVVISPGTDYNIDVKFFAKKMNFQYTGGTLRFSQSNIGTSYVNDGTFLFPGNYNWQFVPSGGGSGGTFPVVVTECP